jgi:putative ABC transport system permease protein
MRRFNVSAGELITLKIRLASGKKIERRYEILGFHENILPGRWSHALMSERYFRLDIGRGYGPVYIKAAGETDDVVNGLREAFGRQKPSITTATGLKEEAMLANRQLFDILEGFSFITLIVGIVGVFNNLIIGFMQRKRQLAVMRSVGMSRFQTVKMFFIESLTGGILGGATGALAGFSAVLVIIPRLVRTLELETHIYNSNVILLSCALSGIVISIAASAGPAFRLMKLNLIDALKYE